MSDEILLRSKNFEVRRTRCTYPNDGQTEVIEYINQPPVVIAVAVEAQARIVLLEHVRPILGTTLLECPGGKVADGESLEEAMYRELSEEVGGRPSKLEKVGSFFTSVGISTEKVHVFLAEDLVLEQPNPDNTGSMRVVQRTFDDLRAMLAGGMLHDGKTQIALSFLLGCPGRLGAPHLASRDASVSL